MLIDLNAAKERKECLRVSQQGVGEKKILYLCHINKLCNTFNNNIIIFISNKINIYNKACVFLMT